MIGQNSGYQVRRMRQAGRRHENHRPGETIEMPPLYRWPVRPLELLKWFFSRFLYPWGITFIALAFIAWYFFSPSLDSMATLQPGWIALLWLRNAGFLLLFAGLLHWRLHIRRAQGKEYKFDDRWLATESGRFLFSDQVRDNLFWSLVSGVTIWTAWEAATLWMLASGAIGGTNWGASPVYLGLLLVLTFFWSSVHFDAAHRPLHWRPVYRLTHALHHKNVNTGPWSGISMRPLEHLVYFSVFIIWWIVPADPVVITLTGFFQGLSPAISHCGFEKIRIGRLLLPAGTHFHTLHHQLFDVNYGQQLTPTDRLFDTWHDGTDDAYRQFDRRTTGHR